MECILSSNKASKDKEVDNCRKHQKPDEGKSSRRKPIRPKEAKSKYLTSDNKATELEKEIEKS
jgi:hypothetical protein